MAAAIAAATKVMAVVISITTSISIRRVVTQASQALVIRDESNMPVTIMAIQEEYKDAICC